ncbi:pectinesterase inhibitor 10-like [Rhodamnia argentea]|uniref:Pectinesterase inhibitor 10-like n=1 Tax=Rhodamnia argentea TaxID=178133 RepID=A0A8B8NZY8_9MYRT|nr:pectinesterase inhibitor 10-like [Rhodamnia argentea]
MESKNVRTLLTLSFFSFVFLGPAVAICVPRNATSVGPSPSPGSPPNSNASPPHRPSPSPEAMPPPPSMAAPPQRSQVEPSVSPSPDSPADSIASPSHKLSPSPESVPPPPSTAAFSQSLLAVDANPPPTNLEASAMLRGSLVQAGAANLAVKKVCDATDYPALCISTLAPFLAGRALLAEPIVLLHAAIKAATAETKLVMAVLGRLIETSHADTRTVMSLKDCHDNYSDALDNFQAATDAIANRDIGTINSMLSAAVTDYGTCDDEFKDGSSPMAGHDSKLSHMADNCLAIASLIK